MTIYPFAYLAAWARVRFLHAPLPLGRVGLELLELLHPSHAMSRHAESFRGVDRSVCPPSLVDAAMRPMEPISLEVLRDAMRRAGAPSRR